MDEVQVQSAVTLESSTGKTSILHLISLTRPVTVIFFGLVVLAGALAAPDPVQSWEALLLAVLSVSLIVAGGNVSNDVVNIEEDRINRPRRPLITGGVGVRTAACVSILLYSAGLAAAVTLPFVCKVIAVAAVVLLCVYNLWGKRPLFIGNLIISVLVALTLPFGSLAGGLGWWGGVPAVFAFFLSQAYEVIRDLEDLPGDRAVGLRTLPMVFGEVGARRFVQITLSILVLLIFLPALLTWLDARYLFLAVPGMGAPAVYVIFSLARGRDTRTYHRLSNVLNACAGAGVLALLTG